MATILVVDDEFGIAELFEALLSDEGHRVLTAMNGKHALEVMAQERPDLIFLDYMMPVMSGAAMLRAMAADARLREIPVVVMSSLPAATIAERSSGYAAFLRKPFRLDEVIALANRLLGKGAASSQPA